MKIIKILFLSAMAAMGMNALAQDAVTFEFDRSDGIPAGVSAATVDKMERNISALLTAINKAQSAHSSFIDYAGIGINDDAQMSLDMLWENVHMRVLDDDIYEKLLLLKRKNGTIRGFEASNIAVEMIPLNDSYKEARNQEITLSLNPDGTISDFVISMGLHQVANMMKGAKTLEDIDRRMRILHFVEQFRTAYCQKDKKFMEDIFSDDALIITGRVRQPTSLEKGMAAVIEYTKHSKRSYLDNLYKKFDNKNCYINVKFSDIEIETSPMAPNFYGVTLRQEWNSTGYSDVGTVFLLWDFTKEDEPKIYVRTWQPLEDTKRFKISNFNVE